jgi:hypothetical protein
MSYITKYLSEIDDLKKEFEDNPDVIKHYVKYEGFTGSSESMTYIEEKIKEYMSLKINENNFQKN